MSDALESERRWTRLGPTVIAIVLVLALVAPVVAANGDGDQFNAPKYTEIHLAVMVLAILLFMTALAFSVLKLGKRQRRVKVHMAIGALAGALAVTGTVFAWWMVERAGWRHLSLTISVAGYITLALILALLVSGFFLSRTKGDGRRVLLAHRVLAAVALVAILSMWAIGKELT